MENNCKDCRFYLPVDVYKGICKIEKTSIGPDDVSCAKFERLPKCKFCQKYQAEKESGHSQTQYSDIAFAQIQDVWSGPA